MRPRARAHRRRKASVLPGSYPAPPCALPFIRAGAHGPQIDPCAAGSLPARDGFDRQPLAATPSTPLAARCPIAPSSVYRGVSPRVLIASRADGGIFTIATSWNVRRSAQSDECSNSTRKGPPDRAESCTALAVNNRSGTGVARSARQERCRPRTRIGRCAPRDAGAICYHWRRTCGSGTHCSFYKRRCTGLFDPTSPRGVRHIGSMSGRWRLPNVVDPK